MPFPDSTSVTAIALDPFVVHDPRFEDVLGESPRLVKVVDADAHEGPVYVAEEDALYFSTLPRGREVFATPGEETVLPDAFAVAWNPSVTGGGKSEDTALVSADGAEVITRTPELGELETAAGIARPAIVVV